MRSKPAVILVFFIFILFSSCEKDSTSIPGNVREFDPVESYEKVHAYAGKDTRLISIYANMVKSDGTLDLKATYNPSVIYTFSRPIQKEVIKEAGPLGSGIKEEKRVYRSELTTVTIVEPYTYSLSINGREPETHYNYGMNRSSSLTDVEHEGMTVDPPGYSFKYTWEQALKREVPSDAVAVIKYDNKGYLFIIRETTISLQFDLFGQLIENK